MLLYTYASTALQYASPSTMHTLVGVAPDADASLRASLRNTHSDLIWWKGLVTTRTDPDHLRVHTKHSITWPLVRLRASIEYA